MRISSFSKRKLICASLLLALAAAGFSCSPRINSDSQRIGTETGNPILLSPEQRASQIGQILIQACQLLQYAFENETDGGALYASCINGNRDLVGYAPRLGLTGFQELTLVELIDRELRGEIFPIKDNPALCREDIANIPWNAPELSSLCDPATQDCPGAQKVLSINVRHCSRSMGGGDKPQPPNPHDESAAVIGID
ncbi:MAG: hypothetical protein AB7P04_02200 [Bacteriovoracia bacterium]